MNDVSKKKKLRAKSSVMDEFADFEDVDRLLKEEDESDDELQALRKAKASVRKPTSATKSAAAYADLSDGDFDFYAAAKRKASKAKEARTEGKQRAAQPASYVSDVAEGRRGASKEIVENRGLKRYRNAEDKNPRVKHRRRFEKALVKRKGLVKEFSEKKALVYDGEKTGIKTHLSRSVSLK